MTNQSSAYDFALFEPKRSAGTEQVPQRKSNVIELPKERLEENRRHRVHLGKIIPTFLAFLVISGIVGTYVNGQVQLSEISDEMGTAQKALQEQQNLYSQMKIKSASAFSMEAIETYATQKLGMKKTSSNQVTAVELSKGDKSQVVAKTSNSNWLERVWEAIKGFLS